jgi:hypothetical protein
MAQVSSVRQGDVTVPAIAAGQTVPKMATDKFIRAFMLQPCEHIEMQQWREAVEAVNPTPQKVKDK